MKKSLLTACAVIASTFIAASPASAADIILQGTTTGCFGVACTPVARTPGNLLGITTIGGLTFTGGAFTQGSSNGQYGIGSVAENLGTFTLLGTSMTYNSPFTLAVAFSLPTGTTPGTGTYNALISGSVSSGNAGGVFVNFDNTAQTFAYNGGSFTLSVADLFVNAGGVATQITGGGVVSGVPEPSTWAMMLAGFGAVGFSMRRRRKSAGVLQAA